MSGANRRGMSIIEAMIAASVVALLMAMAAQFISPMMRMSMEGSFKVEMQQQATLALNQICAELQLTTSDGVSTYSGLATDPVVLATNRIYSIDGSGLPEYQHALQVFYFDPDKDRLLRKVYAGPPPATTITFSTRSATKVTDPLVLRNIATTVNNTERNLAIDVERFFVSSPGNGLYRVALILQKDIPNTQRKSVVELTRQVFLRNS